MQEPKSPLNKEQIKTMKELQEFNDLYNEFLQLLPEPKLKRILELYDSLTDTFPIK